MGFIPEFYMKRDASVQLLSKNIWHLMCFLNMYEMCFLRFLIGKFVCVYFRLLCQQLEQRWVSE